MFGRKRIYDLEESLARANADRRRIEGYSQQHYSAECELAHKLQDYQKKIHELTREVAALRNYIEMKKADTQMNVEDKVKLGVEVFNAYERWCDAVSSGKRYLIQEAREALEIKMDQAEGINLP